MANPETASLSSTAPLVAQPTAAEASFTGKPLQRGRADNLYPMIVGEGDAGFSAGAAGVAGAHVLPPRFDTGKRITVPVALADLGEAAEPAPQKKGFFGRKKEADKFVMVPMSSDEYRLYFAKDEKKQWQEGVVEPEMGRAEWVRLRKEGKI